MSKYCHTKDDVPKTKHWAILTFGSIYVPGDERSRTNPGHGYPGGSQATAEYLAFENKAEWEAKVSEMAIGKYSEKNFVAMAVEPAKIEMKVSVGIS